MLYQQIEKNKSKTFFIFIIFILFMLLVGSAASYYLLRNVWIGMIGISIFCVFYIPITLWRSQSIVMRMNHAKKITNPDDHLFLFHTVENLAMAARIPTPSIYIIEENSPNAFATGMSPKNASVAVTTALLEKLNREEIEAVIAHEIGHIKNYDVRLMTITLALFSVIAIISDLCLRFIYVRDRENSNIFLVILSIVALLLAPFIGMIIQYSVSRNREYLADATGAELCRNPLALASALEKISSDPDPVDNIPSSSAAMYICDPVKANFNEEEEEEETAQKRIGWFDTHPPVEERIKRLKEM